MLDLLSWPHSDFPSMGRGPDWQLCLVIWHGPVHSADRRGWLATNWQNSWTVYSKIPCTLSQWYFINYLCVYIKSVHVHNGIIFQGPHWKSRWMLHLLWLQLLGLFLTAPWTGFEVKFCSSQYNPSAFLLGCYFHHLYSVFFMVFWVLIL